MQTPPRRARRRAARRRSPSSSRERRRPRRSAASSPRERRRPRRRRRRRRRSRAASRETRARESSRSTSCREKRAASSRRAATRSGAFYTLVTIRPRSRGERRSLRTLPGASLRPGSLAFNPDTPRRLSTPTDAFPLHPDDALYGMALRVLLKGRLFAKQGWIFTNDYAETDDRGLPRPHVFTLGAGEVIDGLDVGCLGLREGGVRRVVASPPASYRDKAR